MRKLLRIGIIIGVAAVAMSNVASAAVTAFGTFSFSNFGTGDVTFTNSPAGSTLGPNTIQIDLPGQIVTSLTPTYLGQPNSFCNAGDCGGINGPDPTGRIFVGNSLLFQGGSDLINISGGMASAIDFLFSSGTGPANRYQFTSYGQGTVTTMTVGPSSFLFISYDGQFTDSQGFFLGQSAAVSFTFTQSSAGATVGETASFSTPAVPEPASMALIGGGLVVISLIARRKRKV